MSERRLLFAGLGNPGAGHAGDRHNIGFMTVDAIARSTSSCMLPRRSHAIALSQATESGGVHCSTV